jgi:ABC-type xylose transport system permease subunit
VQKIYFILAWAGWIWLVVAAALLAFALWRKNKNNERRGFEVKPTHDAGR